MIAEARNTVEALAVVFLWTAAVMGGLAVAGGILRVLEGTCGS